MTIMLIVFILLSIGLIITKKQLTAIEDNYIKLSEQVTKINSNLALQYANNIGKKQYGELTSEMVKQISPLIMLYLPDSKMIPYSNPIQRSDYIRGNTYAWMFVLVDTANVDERLINLLGADIRIGIPDSLDNVKMTRIDFVESLTIRSIVFGFSFSANITEAFNNGWTNGKKQADVIYSITRNDCDFAKKKYSKQDLNRAERFELIKESDVRDRLTEVPSLQVFIIIQKILKNVN